MAELLALAPSAAFEWTAATDAAASRAVEAELDAESWYLAGSVAVVPVAGALTRSVHAPAFGVMAYPQIIGAVREAMTSGASALLLHVQSGGGEVEGLFQAADELAAMARAEGAIPSAALIDGMGASAAYALASAMPQVFLASPTSHAGSIGAIALHVDQSAALEKAGYKVSLIASGAHKADANPFEPLSESVRAELQREIDQTAEMFIRRVAQWRGLSAATVAAQEAKIFMGADAVKAGLADGIASAAKVFASLLPATPAKGKHVAMTLPNLSDQLPEAPPALKSVRAERERVSALNVTAHFAARHGAPFDLQAAIESGMSSQEASRSVIDFMAARDEATPTFTMVPTPTDAGVPLGQSRHLKANLRTALAEVLTARVQPGTELSQAAQSYAGASIPDVARIVLQAEGRSAIGSAAMVVASAMHSTSDFPLILEDFVRRTLNSAFNAAPSGLKLVARENTANDFRKISRVNLGEFPGLTAVTESGEFSHGTIGESGEDYRLETFGKIIAITRRALVNDNLSAFADLARRAGQAASDLEAKLLASLLTSNPVMSDGHALFSAAHGNLASSGTSIAAGLSAARQALRLMTGIDGEMIVDVQPRYLVVGADRETEGEQALAAVAAAKIADVNAFANKLELVVDARLTGSGWYVFGDPIGGAPALEYSYLDGQRTPEIVTEDSFETDGIRMRVRHDFGAGVLNWRSAYRNPGN